MNFLGEGFEPVLVQTPPVLNLGANELVENQF